MCPWSVLSSFVVMKSDLRAGRTASQKRFYQWQMQPRNSNKANTSKWLSQTSHADMQQNKFKDDFNLLTCINLPTRIPACRPVILIETSTRRRRQRFYFNREIWRITEKFKIQSKQAYITWPWIVCSCHRVDIVDTRRRAPNRFFSCKAHSLDRAPYQNFWLGILKSRPQIRLGSLQCSPVTQSPFGATGTASLTTSFFVAPPLTVIADD